MAAEPDAPPNSLDASEFRSDFLRGQLREWLEDIRLAGRTAELFELEMWLRSLEQFFRGDHRRGRGGQEARLAARNWIEELRLIDQVLLRVIVLCQRVLTEEQVNQARFGQYVQSFVKRDATIDPYVQKLLLQSGPEASLSLLRDAFESIHVVLVDLTERSEASYATFTAVGKLIEREIRRSDLISLLIDKKFKPIHDRITRPAVTATIRRALPQERKHAARVLLELFRLLRYLEYAQAGRSGAPDLKKVMLIFGLIESEVRLLLDFLEATVLPKMESEQLLYQLYDSFVYCVPLELKKVVNLELLGSSSRRQIESLRVHVENSHGILRDCFQQSVVQLAQVFNPEIEGRDVFDDFVERQERSVELRQGLGELLEALAVFQTEPSEAAVETLRTEVSRFYDNHMRYLMYRDWADFERFFIELLKTHEARELVSFAHRFETFLTTLNREVQKRAVLRESLEEGGDTEDHFFEPDGEALL